MIVLLLVGLFWHVYLLHRFFLYALSRQELAILDMYIQKVSFTEKNRNQLTLRLISHDKRIGHRRNPDICSRRGEAKLRIASSLFRVSFNSPLLWLQQRAAVVHPSMYTYIRRDFSSSIVRIMTCWLPAGEEFTASVCPCYSRLFFSNQESLFLNRSKLKKNCFRQECLKFKFNHFFELFYEFFRFIMQLKVEGKKGEESYQPNDIHQSRDTPVSKLKNA